MNTADPIHPRVKPVLVKDEPILTSFGMSVTRAMDGICEASGVVPAHLVNAAGFGHGSIAFSLMDTACAYAIGSLEIRGVTSNANVTYVRGLSAGSHTATKVEVVSRSKRMATLRGEVMLLSDGEPQLAAHGSFVFLLIEVRT